MIGGWQAKQYTYLCPDEGLLAPLCLRVCHGNPDPKADQSVGLHPAQEFVVLLLDVALKLSSTNRKRLEHVRDAYRCPHLTWSCFLKPRKPTERDDKDRSKKLSHAAGRGAMHGCITV